MNDKWKMYSIFGTYKAVSVQTICISGWFHSNPLNASLFTTVNKHSNHFIALVLVRYKYTKWPLGSCHVPRAHFGFTRQAARQITRFNEVTHILFVSPGELDTNNAGRCSSWNGNLPEWARPQCPLSDTPPKVYLLSVKQSALCRPARRLWTLVIHSFVQGASGRQLGATAQRC